MFSYQSTTNKANTTVAIHTQQDNWVIPHNCELLKAVIELQQLKATDLIFVSEVECKNFIKQLFLMALEDETRNKTPSKLAQLGRELITIHQ